MNLILIAAMVSFHIGPGTAEKPSAVFPFKPGEKPVAVAWTDEGFLVDGKLTPWAKLKASGKDGDEFTWRGTCSDGEPAILSGHLLASAARFEIPSHGELRKRKAEGTVRITPRKAGTVKARMFCQGPRSPVMRQYKEAKVKADETASLVITGDTTDIAHVHYWIYDVDGKLLFQPYTWELRADDFVFALRTLNVDAGKQILKVKSDNWFNREEPHTLRVEMADFDTRRKVWEKSGVKALPSTGKGYLNSDGCKFQEVDIADLKPGQYVCTVTLVDSKGKDVASDYLFFAKPNGPVIWDNTPYGADDTVPPPWTMPAFSESAFTCWNRHVKLGGPGLVSSVFSSAKEVLAEPVTLHLNGKPLEFDVALVERHVSYALYDFTARGGVPIRLRMRADFDGYMLFTLKWAPPVDTLELKVSLPRELVIGFDDCSSAKEKLLLPKGKKCDFEYSLSTKPWWWMGSPAAGMMGGVEDQRGCRVKELKNGYHLTVSDETATLTARFCDTKATDGGEREVVFYLEPTPVKPKNLAIEMTPPDDICIWTDHVEKFFEDKWPGRVRMDKLAPFREMVRKGKRVYYYNASSGVSASFPWWGWFGQDWTIYSSSETYSEEIPRKERIKKDYGAWIVSCTGCKSFFDYKLWSISWYLWNPEFEIKDLYWDLASPFTCSNPGHMWTDEFGRKRTHIAHDSVRELHKRVYRELKKKNPDGTMMGHLTRTRTPSDVFFDALVMGECYDADIVGQMSYYDVLNPEVMQMAYASRSNELTIQMLPQFLRSMQMYAADKLKNFDSKDPKFIRAVRHMSAYFKIHNLVVNRQNALGEDGFGADRLLAKEFGMDRRFTSYYTETCPVKVSAPGPRFIYALYEGNGKKLLIMLNDTDDDLAETVSIEGFSGTGANLFREGGSFDFTKPCEIRFAPREAKFIVFK